MSTNTKKKAVGYTRISTETQEKNTSLETQKAAIAQYCEASGIECVRIYQDIGSGSDTENRPEYKAMLKAVKSKSIDSVVALRLDRVGRNTIEILRLLDTLKTRSCALELIELPINCHSPVGRLIVTILAAVAELERYLILERTTTGRRLKDNKGGYAFGAPQFGWIPREGELIPEMIEQEIINYIRKWNRAGWSLREMAKRLTSLKMPTKRGGNWHPSIISKILKRLKGEKP